MSVFPNTFTSVNLGANNVTLTVIDDCGNSDSCIAVVTVIDENPPSAVCKNITLELDASGAASITGNDIDGGSTDNGQIVSYSASPNTFDCSSTGTNNVTLTVTDDAGLTDTCIAEVTVEDNIAPTAICQDITIELDNNGEATITASDIDNGSSDNCTFTLSASKTTFDCSNVGTNTVTLTVTDASGNTATCDATVTVEDNEDPTITCSANQTQTADNGNCSAMVIVHSPTTADNCGIAGIENDFNHTANATDTYPVGTTTITWTVTDDYGNTNSCTQDIIITDDENPSITCSADQTQTADNGSCEAAVTVLAPTSNDNCGVASISNDITGTSDATATYPVGTTTVTWTVTDIHGNTNTCTQDITVTDDENPTITCSADQVQTADNGNCSAAVSITAPTTADNCGVASITNDFTNTSDASGTYPVGTTTVTWTVTDIHGNTNTCTQDITVTDDENPLAVCQDITVNLDNTGHANITGTDVDNGSTDNCGIANYTVLPNAFTSADLGANNVVLTVTDIHGNTSTCNAVVTVTDLIPPTAICKDITIELDANGAASITGMDIDNGSYDNGTVVAWDASPNTFDCTNVGSNNVVLTVTDNAGLTNTCIAHVTVEDNINPIAICQDITVGLDENGVAIINAADLDNGSSDNCEISFSVLPSSLDCDHIGPNNVVFTVTDQSGNTADCQAVVTVEDHVSPIIICPADKTQTADLGACNTFVTVDAPQVDDNCGIASVTNSFNGGVDASGFYQTGTTTVVWTAVDVNGNVKRCYQHITILDEEDPIIYCLAEQIQSVDAGQCQALVTVIAPIVTDNCGIASVINDYNETSDASGVYPVGITSIVWTAEDYSGNINTCTQDIIVTDDEVPSIICSADQVQTADNGNCSAAVSITAPTTADN
jgi:hypothetical protein